MFEVGFLPIRFWDILDVAIVGYLLYRIYKLLRGSIAFNIFIGVLILYLVWWLVGLLKMELLTLVLDQFVSVGVIILIIIFQPEVRRFLLLLGNTTLRGRSNFFRRWLDKNLDPDPEDSKIQAINAIKRALLHMSKKRIGALIVLGPRTLTEGFCSSGTNLNARISQALVESIFAKEGPLHDGAMIISEGRIVAASCILPVSDNQALPKKAGLRHRAAVGATEAANVACFVVSEESGEISFAHRGTLQTNLDESKVADLLLQHF